MIAAVGQAELQQFRVYWVAHDGVRYVVAFSRDGALNKLNRKRARAKLPPLTAN